MTSAKGSVHKEQKDGKTSYRGRIKLADGTQRTKKFERKRDAERWRDEELARFEKEHLLAPPGATTSFDEWASRFFEQKRLGWAGNTRQTKLSDLKWALRQFGHLTLSDITVDLVQHWVNDMDDYGAAPGSVINRYGLLRQILLAAVDRELIAKSPCKGVALPQRDGGPRGVRPKHILTPAELDALADAIDPRYRAMVLVAGTGGLRLGELQALRRRQVDFARGHITIDAGIRHEPGGRVERQPKSAAGTRLVPLPGDVVEVLGDHVERYGVGRDDLVFTSVQGKMLIQHTWRIGHLYPAAETAGLQPPGLQPKDHRRIRPHDLRHTAVSTWIASGMDAKQVQLRAGHSSIKVTYDIYGHLFPGYSDTATEGLERFIAEQRRQAASGAEVISLRRREA
jgi:integrase